MTLMKLGDFTVVLEKVCAYEYVRPRVDSSGQESGQASLRILLEGGHDFTVYGQASISAFVTAMKALGTS